MEPNDERMPDTRLKANTDFVRLDLWQNRSYQERIQSYAYWDELSPLAKLVVKPDHRIRAQHNSNDMNTMVTAKSDQNLAVASCQSSSTHSATANLRSLQSEKHPALDRITSGQPKQNNTIARNGASAYPPRTSSIYEPYDTFLPKPPPPHKMSHHRQRSDTPVAQSQSAKQRGNYLSTPIPGYPAPLQMRPAARSSADEELFSASAFIGNFIPFESRPASEASVRAEHHDAKSNSFASTAKSVANSNPFEFDPASPDMDRQRSQQSQQSQESHQTTFTDFIVDARGSKISSKSERIFLKKSPSVNNSGSESRRATPFDPVQPTNRLQRSESSPVVSAKPRFQTQHQEAPSPSVSSRYGIADQASTMPRGRSPSPQGYINRRYVDNEGYTTSRQYNPGHVGSGRPSSPVRAPTPSQYHQQSHMGTASQEYSVRAPASNRYANNSYSREHRPDQYVQDAIKSQAESNDYQSVSSCHRAASPSKDPTDAHGGMHNSETSSRSPKKRSRSPMKRMFGDNGWLGRSPADFDPVGPKEKRAPVQAKEKVTMMGKLRSKLDVFAEKADLSPTNRLRHNTDRPAKISVLTVSLQPPEQARLFMEVELMLVHTANSFLMNQFSQGRIEAGTIKKVVDAWKAKGRPTVIEFMYDQATQRDLVAINQQNLRFHGERAGDSIRVNSMLYNWKLVASQMAIRTFCDGDAVILKLMFDIEQILELLGASHMLRLRLQEIRDTTTERMRFARQQLESNRLSEDLIGRERVWHHHGSTSEEDRSMRDTMNDPYGGMKLVPDGYHE